MEIPTEELKLNRKLQNHAFQSWRLKHGSLRSRSSISLPAPVVTARNDAVDYVHTRARVLRNHLLASRGRLFCFLHRPGHAGELQVAEACCSVSGTEAGCSLRLVSVLTSHGPASTEAVVDPSLAVLDASALASQRSQPDSSGAAPATLGSVLHNSLLVSSGSGEVSLLYPDTSSGVFGQQQPLQCSAPVSPLRPLPPLLGQRPLVIEAAYAVAPDVLRCVAWAAKSAAATPGASRQRPHTSCETYVLTLRATASVSASAPQPSTASASPAAAVAAGAQASVQLQVLDVRLLRTSDLPPHLVMANPAQDALLLGLSPGSCGGEEQGSGEADITHIDCRSMAGASSLAADDIDDVDPRTLQEAAARLAKYTSDDAQAEPPQQQWSDVFKESGPDGVGAMGGELPLELLLLPAGPSEPSEQHAGQGSASSSAGNGANAGDGARNGASSAAVGCSSRVEWQLTCGASRVLTCESSWEGLVGLNDDVDCAVLSVTWPPAQRHPTVLHEAYVPALAYVAAGKVHKKHLLLGHPHSPISAVLVEAQRLYYVYRKTSNRQEAGLQDLAEMELHEGESILGARLVDLKPKQSGSTGSVAVTQAGPAAHGTGAALLLLTQHRLMLHHLTAE